MHMQSRSVRHEISKGDYYKAILKLMTHLTLAFFCIHATKSVGRLRMSAGFKFEVTAQRQSPQAEILNTTRKQNLKKKKINKV